MKRTKAIFSVLLVLVMVISAFSFYAAAEELDLSLEEDGLTLTFKVYGTSGGSLNKIFGLDADEPVYTYSITGLQAGDEFPFIPDGDLGANIGYYFSGWFEDYSGHHRFIEEFPETVTENATYWIFFSNPYDISFGFMVVREYRDGDLSVKTDGEYIVKELDPKTHIVDSRHWLKDEYAVYEGKKYELLEIITEVHHLEFDWGNGEIEGGEIIVIPNTFVWGSPISDGRTYFVRFVYTLATESEPADNLQRLAGGSGFSLFLKNDGTAWSSGWNVLGQLGIGNTTDQLIPRQITSLGNEVTSMAAGLQHGLALKSDGTVWAWGQNASGQVGDGSPWLRYSPVRVIFPEGTAPVKMIAAGDSHSIALDGDGNVWTWGNNNYGQLGDGSDANRITPVQVENISGVTAIAGGDAHSLALDENGVLWAWGRNNSGQLGNGTKTASQVPVMVGLTGVTAIAAGNTYSAAVTDDGSAYVWGNNYYGQLGVTFSTLTESITPVRLAGLPADAQMKSLSVSNAHTLALTADGKVMAWGRNSVGQLGTGSFSDDVTLKEVVTLNGISGVAAGYTHSLAVDDNGNPWSWGANGHGQLGNGGTEDTNLPSPVMNYSE